MRFFCFLKHIRLFRCVAQQCWCIGKLIFRAKKRLAGRQPYDHIWSYIVTGSYAEGGLRSQDPRLYSVRQAKLQGGAEKASSARPCLWGQTGRAWGMCFLGRSCNNDGVAIAAIVVNSAAITRTMTTTRHCHASSVKGGSMESLRHQYMCKSAFHEERFLFVVTMGLAFSLTALRCSLEPSVYKVRCI